LNFLTAKTEETTPRGSDANYLNAPIPSAQMITSDPNNLTSNYTQSVPQASQKMSKDDALAFLTSTAPSEQTAAPINIPAIQGNTQQTNNNQATKYAGAEPESPSYNPIENALRNFANTAATSTLNTAGGAVRYFSGAQQKDLKMAQEELAQAEASGESPEQISEIQGRIDRFNEQIPQVQETAKSIIDLSNQYPEAYGVNLKDKSTSAQIGRGLGQVASFIPTMALGPAGGPLGGLQAASQAYEGTYQQTLQTLKEQGVKDNALIEDKAQREASIAAVKSLPQLGVYMFGGKLASAGVSKLLSTQKPLIQGVAGAVAGSIANTAAGATIRKFMGESVMPTVESLTQDIAFGLFHGVGTGVEAQERIRQQKAKLGPSPKLNPSADPAVNQKEALITANANAQAPLPEAPAPINIPAKEATAGKTKEQQIDELFSKQFDYPEGSPEHTAIQAEIDALNKPAEAPVSTLDQQLQDLTDEQNRLVIEELPKYPEGSVGRRQVQDRIDAIRMELNELDKQRVIDISEETPAEAPVAEAQPNKPSAVQITSATQTMLRPKVTGQGEVVELPRVGEQNAEVPAKEGEAPKEVVVPASLEEAKTVEEVDAYVKSQKESFGKRTGLDEGSRQRRLKALGMQSAARKRQITGQLTAIEQAAKTKREESNYKGKPVSVDGRNGTIIGNPFGRVKVRFSDGTESTHLPEKIEAPVEVEVPTEVAPTEPEKPQEVVLTEEQQAEKVLLDKIDAEAGRPKPVKPKAPESNPYTDILSRYESGEENAITTPSDLVNEVNKIAKRQRNQYLKDAVDRYKEAVGSGRVDVEPEIEKLLNEVKREENAYEEKKSPSKKTAKTKEKPFGSGDAIIEYLQSNKIQSKSYWQKSVRRKGETPGEGEYGSMPKLPKKHAESIYGKYGIGQTPSDAIKGLHENGQAFNIENPDQLWDYIKSQSDTTKGIGSEEKQQDAELKKLEDSKKEIEAAKDNPDKLAAIEAEVLQEHFESLRRRGRGEGGFIEFPDFIKDAAIRVGDAVRKGVTSFKDWSNGMIERLGEGVRGFLKDIWASVRDNWNKDIGGGFDTGGRSLEKAAEEAKFAPKALTDKETFAKRIYDSSVKQRGRPPTQEEMASILSNHFANITPSEITAAYDLASGKPKPPAAYSGVAQKEAPKGEKISLKNASAEAEAESLGLPELSQQDEQEMNVAMDRAKAISEQDPFAGQRLAESLISDPTRSLTGDESALLLKHKTDLFNSLNKMAEGLTEGSPEQKFEKGLAYDNASKSYRDLLQAIKDRGSEWGREGRWRQALLHQDYTFATQERLATAAKRKPLTSNEKTKLAEETKRLTEIDKEIAERKEKEANKQEQRKVEQEIKKAPAVDPYIQSIVDRITKNVSSAADAARERIEQRRKERRGRFFTGVDFDVLADIPDATIIGADYLIKGTAKFADWSSKMIGYFGEEIRPYLNDIFNKSKEFNEQQVDKESKGSKSVKKRIVKASSPEERIRKGQETRARNRLEELKQEEERQKKGDFSKPVKKAPIEPSEKTKALRIESQKIKDRIDERKASFEKANRPLTNKVLDAISSLNRFNILSHITVLEHLAGAAVENIVTRPVSSTISQVFRFNKTLNSIRKKAIYEGGLSAKSELKGVFGIVTSAKDVWSKLLKGKANIDWLYGGKNNFSPSFVRVVENIHGAMKEPVRQGIFSRSLQLRIDSAKKMGLDPTNDEVLYRTLASEAVNDANMDIFMGDNFITRGIRGLMKGFETNKQSPRLGKFVSTLMEIAMPVMNVPTNIAIRKMRLAGGILESATRIGIASKEGKLANGAETLTNQEAEQIMRAFKYGTLGIAIGAYAWTHANQFGGIVNNVGPNAPSNEKLKKGEMELGGVKIAKPLGHGPVATFMNMIADARRMYDKSVRNNPNSKWSSLSESAFFSMFVSGLGSMPTAQAATRFFSPFTTAGQKMGQTVRDMLINGAVQDVAAKMDTNPQPKNFIDFLEAEPIKRSPKTFQQEVMKGIPGLRNELPSSKPKGSGGGSSKSKPLGSIGGSRSGGGLGYIK
jgi:hypothetical protein